jgi:hypothetical protein
MMENILRKMITDNVIDYGVLLQARAGLPGINVKLPHNVIAEFAMLKLANSLDSSEEKLLIDLTSAHLLSDEEIMEILSKLCQFSKVNTEISFRKWRVYLLADLLQDLDLDPLYSLIRLSEFWLDWQKVLDDKTPHIYQGVDNALSPDEYYSIENMSKIIDSQRRWIEEEKNTLFAN